MDHDAHIERRWRIREIRERFLPVSKAYLLKRIASGELRATRLDGVLLVPESALREFLEQRERPWTPRGERP